MRSRAVALDFDPRTAIALRKHWLSDRPRITGTLSLFKRG